jgi:hypothetical protein
VKPSLHFWVCAVFGCALSVPALAQVAPEANGGSSSSDTMMAPPPVSGISYPSVAGGEVQSNYLSGGVGFTSSYIDNFNTGNTTPLAETTYSVTPKISYDQVTPRQHAKFSYQPGFTFYTPTSSLNETDENATAMYLYRLSQHVAVTVNNVFTKSSNAFGTNEAVSGSTQPVAPGIVAPFAERLTDTASGQISYQFSATGMIGGGGTYRKLNYPNPSEVSGLYDSDEEDGSAYYARRIGATQYLGGDFMYAQVVADVQKGNVDTQTQTASAFFTVFFNQQFSVSVTGGAQHYLLSQAGQPVSLGGWEPTVTASIGWQQQHTNLAANYSRAVTAGSGLLGVYLSESANLSWHWLLTRTWSVGAGGTYALNRTAESLPGLIEQGGHSISGSVTAQHEFGQQVRVQFEYDRIDQSYSGIASIADNPNADRGTVSVFWEFNRPLGR